jgi:hypothetical protein
MNKYFVLSVFLLLCCFFLPNFGCPFDVGDIVADESSGKIGVVKSIHGLGAGSSDCMCAVLYKDGTWSKNNTIIYGESLSKVDNRYVYSWSYRKVNDYD